MVLHDESATFPENTSPPVEYLADGSAQFRFAGTFQQQHVHWDTHLLNCRLYQRSQDPGLRRQFIDIQPTPDPQVFRLTVCLDLERVDAAAIEKTIIMIRQYRKLALNRHYFGHCRDYACE